MQLRCEKCDIVSKQGNTTTAHRPSNWSVLTLGQNVWLHISIVILAGPNKSPGRLQDLGHHVVNETVLIPDLQLVKLWLVLPKKDRIIIMFYFSFMVIVSSLNPELFKVLTLRRCPGRCLWSARRRPWGWCFWCSCTEATSSVWHTGSSCGQIH